MTTINKKTDPVDIKPIQEPQLATAKIEIKPRDTNDPCPTSPFPKQNKPHFVDTPESRESLSHANTTPAPAPNRGPGIDPDKFPPKVPKTPIDPRVQLKNTNTLKK